LTTGDGNTVDDRGLYEPGQLWLEKKDIVGKVKGYVSFHVVNYLLEFHSTTFRYFPYVGMLMIIMNDLHLLSYFTLVVMGLFVLINCKDGSSDLARRIQRFVDIWVLLITLQFLMY